MRTMKPLLLILLTVATLLAAGCATGPRETPVRLTLLTYNIHHGAGMDRKLDLQRIAALIDSQKPDWVALQEVEDQTSRTKHVDQTAELARLTGLNGFFAKAFDFSGGGYGNATLSRHPRITSTVTQLPLSGEPRCFTDSLIAIPNLPEPIHFIATHLDVDHPAGREKQVKAILTHVGQLSPGAPVILAGDFNATPEEAPITLLLATPGWIDATSKSGNTIPSDRPTSKIDYILIHPGNTACRVITARVIEEKVASDHRPVACTLELVPK